MTSGEQELHTLAGAFVLDAISGDERAGFAAHLSGCAQCSAEIRELREAVARLGASAGEHPRAELRDAVLSAARRSSQLAPVLRGDGGRRPRWRPRALPRTGRLPGPGISPKLAIAAAAVMLAGAAGLGVFTQGAMRQLHHSQHQDHMIAAVLTAPDAVLRTARVTTGGTAAVVLSRREHMGVFTAHGLRALPPGRSYELWLMGPGGDRPAGLLTARAAGMAGPAVVAGITAGEMIGLTIEPAGGSPRPTTSPLVLIGQQGY